MSDYEDQFRSDLADHLAQFTAAPILFVGSGVSRRYLSMPDWQSLLETLAELTDREFSYYRSTASEELPRIAELLVEPLKERLWTPKEKSLRNRHTDHLIRPDSALKIYVAEVLRSIGKKNSVPRSLRSEVAALGNAKVDAIITTNYDGFLESVFPDYRAFVGQDELVFSDPTGIAEIYKIHGSLDDPNSLIITESDYEAFRERNAYLAAKLLTFFAEHPVIFIGYSMTDSNVQSILGSLANCLTDEHMSRLQDRLLFVDWVEGSQHSMVSTVIGANAHNVPVRAITAPDFQAIFDVLAGLDQKIPKRTLRQIKEKIYKLVLDSEAQERLLHVTDLDAVSDDEAEFVVGLGVIAAVQKRGYKMVTRQELCHDVLYETGEFDSDFVVKMTLPEMLSRPGNFPMYKYLKAAGYLDANGHIKDAQDISPKLLKRVEDTSNLRPSTSIMRKAKQLAQAHGSLTEMIDYCTTDEVLAHFGALPHSGIDVRVLKTFLTENEDEYTDEDGKLTSPFAKAVCIYDLLKYGPKLDWTAA
ncbi:SIR2 family protein [Mycobacteroides abscessus subsp. abscessus]|uniref:SIR2 family protein n=1 Tax=Mycobacteroides abscessus TaxID=36809 RepID=UPI0019D10B3F|nr:SIR2 family protein [Mycobacteroides abscessus]QSM92975.1 SIR2 family protein [Mycobacteroides abscessus subsp. abscessus]QSM98013.1 SIR2 family protein [Mycobacteroides abscessus subsp. abscessus]